jgi:hypothetical protein
MAVSHLANSRAICQRVMQMIPTGPKTTSMTVRKSATKAQTIFRSVSSFFMF